MTMLEELQRKGQLLRNEVKLILKFLKVSPINMVVLHSYILYVPLQITYDMEAHVESANTFSSQLKINYSANISNAGG